MTFQTHSNRFVWQLTAVWMKAIQHSVAIVSMRCAFVLVVTLFDWNGWTTFLKIDLIEVQFSVFNWNLFAITAIDPQNWNVISLELGSINKLNSFRSGIQCSNDSFNSISSKIFILNAKPVSVSNYGYLNESHPFEQKLSIEKKMIKFSFNSQLSASGFPTSLMLFLWPFKHCLKMGPHSETKDHLQKYTEPKSICAQFSST